MSLLNLERDIEAGAEGVYRVYLKASPDDEVTLYIGKSKNLLRRRNEYARCTKFCRTNRTGLDTIMVVHTMLRFLEAKGVDCYFEHESWSQDDEKDSAKNLVPTLQRLDGTACIRREYFLPKRHPDYWEDSAEHRAEAQARLFQLFEAEQWPLIQALCPILREKP